MEIVDTYGLAGSYDFRIVALSVAIAILASYTALDLGGRVTAARDVARSLWLAGGAVAMGIGIWSMHYVGMLAFILPVPVRYDWPTALWSLLIGIFSSALALFVVSRRRMGSLRATAGSIFMGGGIAALHYTAMASMRLPAMCLYSPALVTLSVLLAVAFSGISLWLTFLFRGGASGQRMRKAASALLMGAATSAMHYTGMASVRFVRSAVVGDLSHSISISFLDTVGIAAVAAMVLGITLVTSLMDRLQLQRALLDELFEQGPVALALTTADNRVVRVNREFTRLFGYTRQESLGRSLSDLIVPDESRAEVQHHLDLAAQGRRVELDGVRQRRDGRRVDVVVVRVPVSMPNGRTAIYAIFLDITERKRAEEQLQATSEQLRALSVKLRSAREEEGTRIAREIHDELGSALTGLRWELEEALKLITDAGTAFPADQVRGRLESMIGVTDTTINTVRRIASELRPAVLDDLGLVAAIEWQAQQFQARTGIVCQCESTLDEVPLSREQSTAVFRIFQEALTNVTRHAKASRVDITMEEEGHEFVLTIRDNGKGIGSDEKSGAVSLGLLGMRERARLAGGRIEIIGREGSGTIVTVKVPISS